LSDYLWKCFIYIRILKLVLFIHFTRIRVYIARITFTTLIDFSQVCMASRRTQAPAKPRFWVPQLIKFSGVGDTQRSARGAAMLPCAINKATKVAVSAFDPAVRPAFDENIKASALYFHGQKFCAMNVLITERILTYYRGDVNMNAY
jgi:hypothetical protein